MAAQVTARSPHRALPRIQGFTGHSGGQRETAPDSVAETLATPGAPLAAAVRTDMEQRLGHDFSKVRIHADETAARSARHVSAHAYTWGHDIVFGAGRFQPQTRRGQQLLAHELTHVVQQATTPGPIMRDAEGQSAPDNPQELEEAPPEWVQAILGNRELSMRTQLRLLATHEAVVGRHRGPAVLRTPPAEQPGAADEQTVSLLADSSQPMSIRLPALAMATGLVSAAAPGGTEDWLLSFLKDPKAPLVSKLRAMGIRGGYIGSQQKEKSEEEFIEGLSAQTDNASADGASGLSSDEAAKAMTEHFIRNRAVAMAMELMGADWHAAEGSEARKKAEKLHAGQDPQKVREMALTGGMLWVYENQEKVQKIRDDAVTRYQQKKSEQNRLMAEAADAVLTAVTSTVGAPLAEQQQSQDTAEFADKAWRYLGSETSKKYLEKVGFPLAWFTTCLTLPKPVAEAAGVDTTQWGPMDMFDKRKGKQERFKEAQESQAWVPADKGQQPKPGDVIMFVTYLKDPWGKVQKDLSKAVFQHVSILVLPVSVNADGTERWVTADGGKGSSHQGQDKTGTTERRYNPKTQQFIPNSQTNLQEAAEGGRYLLGFWDIARLPMRPPDQPKKAAKKTAKTGK